MKIDLVKIDAQIKRLEEVRRIASDPELLSLLETVLVTNGSGAPILPLQAAPALSGNGRLERFQEDTTVRAVAEYCLRQEKPFSGYALAELMKANGFKFKEGGKTAPGQLVTDICRNALLKRGIVRVWKKGKANQPTLYERIL
jgi:hypothetical protein